MRALIACSLAVLLGTASPAHALLRNIGAAGGVSGRVVALADEGGSVGRVMSSGKAVFLNDKVTTDARGRMQVLLNDQTTFTIGPDTELVLDGFEFEPFNNEGKISATVKKGVFRFVTGSIARKKPDNMKIKLPVGTIGIRGTIGAASTDGNSAVVALIGPGPQNNADEKPGAVTVTNAGVTQTITRTGYYSEIPGPDQPPTPPAPMTDEVSAKVDPKPKAESKDDGDSGPGGGSSATEASGEQTAGAKGDLSSTQSTGQLAQSFDSTTNSAGQDSAEGIADGPSSWDQVRASILTGTGFYSMTGAYACSGGTACSTPGNGSWSASVDVDFTNRVICGLNFNLTSGPLSGQSSSLSGPFIPFGSGGGTAEYAFTSSNLTNSAFQGTEFTFLNKDGVAGKAGQVEMAFSSGLGTIDSSTKGEGNFQAQ